jgi:hypothetical protein
MVSSLSRRLNALVPANLAHRGDVFCDGTSTVDQMKGFFYDARHDVNFIGTRNGGGRFWMQRPLP